MRNLIVVGVLMLGLGFAIGWVAKPAPLVKENVAAVSSTKSASEGAAPKATAEPLVQGKRSDREASPPKAPNKFTDEQMKQGKKMQAEMSKAMMKRMREKFENQIEKMSANMNLTPDQKAKLTAWLDERMDKLDGFDMTDGKNMKSAMENLGALTNKSLEEQLMPTLTEDQKTALTEFNEHEIKSKADNAALKSLSKLQGAVEFEEGQRDEVYKILMEGAEADVRAEDEKPDISKMFTEGMGFEMDPYDLGIQKAMTDTMGADPSAIPAGDDQKEALKKIRATIDQRIDAKVERLRPALNDKQLDQYRNELKTKGLGVYGAVLNGMEGATQ